MEVWVKKQGIKILIGTALLVLPVIYLFYQKVSLNPLNPHEHLIQNVLAYMLFLSFSYFNHKIFVPRWILTKQYLRYGIVSVTCVIVVAYLPYRVEQWAYFRPPTEHTVSGWVNQIFFEEMMLRPPGAHPPQHRRPPEFDQGHRGHPDDLDFGRPDMGLGDKSFALFLPIKLAIFFLLGLVSTLLSVSVLMASRIRQVENDQLHAELRQLKAQIHPHFLFNTLNCIYALSLRNDERTSETIVKLSEFMRFIISDAHRDKVPLTAELNYISNYIDLQKARLRDAVRVDYQVTGEYSGLQLAPLILFSFIENAFKYGVDPEEDSLICIHLDVTGQQIRLKVGNRKFDLKHMEKSTGVGLYNTKERLRLLYPSAHQLEIEDGAEYFKVDLILNI